MPDPRSLATRWIVLLRDLSASVHVRDEPSIAGCVVIDESTGLLVGVRMEPDAPRALDGALQTGRDHPPEPLAPGLPDVLWCDPSDTERVVEAARRLAGGAGRVPDVQPAPVPAWAEDLFDSLVSHLSGREHPDELADPEDWELAYGAMLAYVRAEPWRTKGDDEPFYAEMGTEESATFRCHVLGQSGIQRGLVLYPVASVPDDPEDWPEEPDHTGSLICFVEAAGKVPADLAARARRYAR
jgi:hypothetical protein